MELIAVTAQDVGVVGDKLISVVGIVFCFGVFGAFAAARRRRAGAARDEARDAERAGDIQKVGPPKFNG